MAGILFLAHLISALNASAMTPSGRHGARIDCQGLVSSAEPSQLVRKERDALAAIRELLLNQFPGKKEPPELIEYSDHYYRSLSGNFRNQGLESGYLIWSASDFEKIIDGRYRSFLVLPHEGILRIAENNNPGEHLNLGLFQEVTTAGEFSVTRLEEGRVVVAMTPRSGSYYKNKDPEIDWYLVMGRALEAIWNAGVFPDQFTVLDYESREPLLTVDLTAVRPLFRNH